MKYFLHDSNSFNDEKITQLYIAFGYEGLGLFYTLLEKLAGQEKPIKTEVLKSQLNIGKKLNKCWNFMENIGIIHSNNGETFNKQLLKYSEKYLIKKQNSSERTKQWRNNQEDKENVTHNVRDSNAHKDNISKDNISKVKLSNAEVPSASYKTCLDFYFKWHEKRIGVKPQFDGGDGKALKEIIKYFESLESGDENVIKNFSAIFSGFDSWDKFHQGQTRMRQINSNLTNIINLLKNGKSNSKATLAGIADEMAKRNYE